ncbi:MAG: hypothetical protein ACLRZH_04420 [Ruthenibacterium lactatiformans]
MRGSSAAEQNLYGGVVPEIASRRHIEHISQVARPRWTKRARRWMKSAAWRSPLRPGSSARCWWA